MPDQRALKTLFDRCWSHSGWRPEEERSTSDADFEYAKRAGIMFDDAIVTHDDALARVIAARDALSVERVANAFLASLSSRRLDLRSALGSYAVFRHATAHAPMVCYYERCDLCGAFAGSSDPEDLNVLNFERFKWGGVRHDDPVYTALDLNLFLAEPQQDPSQADIEILRALIHAVETSPASVTSINVESRLSGVFKSNKAERDVVVAILGFCGILESPGHPGYRERFIPLVERARPSRQLAGMQYPACWWRSRDGVNRIALDEYFGHAI
jgi:hypothetical protein